MNPCICRFLKMNLSTNDNLNFARPEPVYVYNTKFVWRYLCATTNFVALPIEHGLPLI